MRIECPTCKTVIENAPEDFAPRPFCSVRCKLADLHAWLNEDYKFSESLPLEPSDDHHMN